MSFLTKDELDALMPAEMLPHTTPIPTQVVSSDEYYPQPQNKKQREVEARVKSLGTELARKQGVTRRAFFHHGRRNGRRLSRDERSLRQRLRRHRSPKRPRPNSRRSEPIF